MPRAQGIPSFTQDDGLEHLGQMNGGYRDLFSKVNTRETDTQILMRWPADAALNL
jgi:hypothetical protein